MALNGDGRKADGRITGKLPLEDQERHEARAARLDIGKSEYLRKALAIAEPELEAEALRREEAAQYI